MNEETDANVNKEEEYDRGFTGAQIHHHTLIDQYIQYISNEITNNHTKLHVVKHLERIKHLIRIGYWDVSVFDK